MPNASPLKTHPVRLLTYRVKAASGSLTTAGSRTVNVEPSRWMLSTVRSPPIRRQKCPLIIQDHMFNADGTFLYPPGVPTPATSPITAVWSPELFGDVATVNGKAWPNLDVKKGLYRFRIYNGSNARAYDLGLGNNQVMWQIGTDGGLLPAPVQLKQLLLMPRVAVLGGSGT